MSLESFGYQKLLDLLEHLEAIAKDDFSFLGEAFKPEQIPDPASASAEYDRPEAERRKPSDRE